MTSYGTLTKRSEFTAARKGKRMDTGAFTIQAVQRRSDPDAQARFGLTVTKKTGNAVERNRIKRRLRAMVRALPADAAGSGIDHVLFARREALRQPFAGMVMETDAALRALAARLQKPPRKRPPPTPEG